MNLFLSFFCGLLLVLSSFTHVFALETIIVERLESTTGSPVEQAFSFPKDGFTDFVLKVQNGNSDGSQRISSAIVYLNDSRIIGPSSLNQKTPSIQQVIAPKESENIIRVSLRSNPGGFLNIQVLGEPTFNLPPDPGPAGEVTLEGIDVNENGIRDDVERWIYLYHPESEKLRMALIQDYAAMQNMIIHANEQNRDAVYNDMDASSRASECLTYLASDEAYKLSMELESVVVNTSTRTYAYLQASKMLSGGTFTGKPYSKWKFSCNFDVDSLKD